MSPPRKTRIRKTRLRSQIEPRVSLAQSLMNFLISDRTHRFIHTQIFLCITTSNMSDPFSVSAGVVGVVSLSLTLCQGFLRYYAPWRDFAEEIQGFTTKVDGLLRTLRVLGGFLSPENELHLQSDQYRRLVLDNLTSCEEACRQLEKMLMECNSTDISSSPSVRKHDWLRLKRAVYPFKRETLVTLSQLVSGLQDNVNFALQLLNGALISEQQRQIQHLISRTSSIDIRTTTILSIVEPEQGSDSVVSSQAVVHQVSPSTRGARSAALTMPEPSTVRDLCQQRQLINMWARGRRRLPSAPINQLSHYCTCQTKPRFLSRFSFSSFALHEKSCLLYVDGQTALGISGHYTYCNSFFGLSIRVMMTLTRGAGGLAISPMIQLQSVVSYQSPAFKLMAQVIRKESNMDTLLEDLKTSLLRMFCEGKAAPTDCLPDGSTLLHGLLGYAQINARGSAIGRCWSTSYLITVVRALIDAGVPLNQRTVYGMTALDIFIQNSMKYTSEVRLGVLQELLTRGGCINSFAKSASPGVYSQGWEYPALHAARYLLPKYFEGFELSEIEIAILSRSEESLERCLMVKDHHQSPLDPPMPHYSHLLFLTLGWPVGLSAMLEFLSPPPYSSVGACLEEACLRGELECAIILCKHLGMVTVTQLQAASRSKNIPVLKLTIAAFVTSRRKLQQLALEHLPRHVLCSLSLPTGSLLDTNAYAVSVSLYKHNIEVTTGEMYKDTSVYSVIDGDITTAELLYEAGFTDLNHYNSEGLTPLMLFNTRWRDHPDNLGCFENWMVRKGADIHRYSGDGFPASFYLAERFGVSFSSWLYRMGGYDERKTDIQSSIQQQPADDARSICFILTDSTHDDCFCACSGGACTSLQRILRGFAENIGCVVSLIYDMSVLSVMFDELQHVIPEAFTENTILSVSYQTIRYLTFSVLGLTHTCHDWHWMNSLSRVKQMDPEEIEEVREEERSLIDQLEDLSAEFRQKYEELGLGIYGFLVDYWRPRMDEVLAAVAIDDEERTRVREIGVVLEQDE
ncbi:hypothetical protein BDW59DRAFT_167633 [Aspergillus cavernicola]|uniref:Fungal N-terminal domain-containing protein n=1 Tax=Aspergillus cavernicola TaxID=176166 RepID=A0ABR4HC91_9EURO